MENDRYLVNGLTTPRLLAIMPLMALSIRNLEARDLDHCATIVANTPLFTEYAWSAQTARKNLDAALHDPGAVLLAAEDENQNVVGFAWFITRGAFARSGYLRLIAVAGDVHGKGVGAALLGRLEEQYLKPNGLFLLVTEKNSGARRFYEKQGYSQVGRIPGYVKEGLDECIYFKKPV